MLFVNADELPKEMIFNCCSYPMMKFLTDHEVQYVKVCKKWNKRKEDWVDCYVFMETPRLNELRREWTTRKESGNLYYKKGGEQ